MLGWKEEAALPEWGIKRLRVKLDTGARTSSLHAVATEQVGEHWDGERTLPVVRLRIPLSRSNPERCVETVTPVVDYKSVRDTGANTERRAVVRTRLVCGPIDRDILVTITDRSRMIFRMILGREALEGSAIVDPSRGYVALHHHRLRQGAHRR